MQISLRGKLQIPGNVHIRLGTGAPDSIGSGHCCNSLPNHLCGQGGRCNRRRRPKPTRPSSEKALLRRVVPAVGFLGHRLAQMIVPDDLNEFQAGVAGTLIAVDQGSCL